MDLVKLLNGLPKFLGERIGQVTEEARSLIESKLVRKSGNTPPPHAGAAAQEVQAGREALEILEASRRSPSQGGEKC